MTPFPPFPIDSLLCLRKEDKDTVFNYEKNQLLLLCFTLDILVQNTQT